MSFNINKIHYTSVELFKFKSLSMHLNIIHVYTVSFRQGNKQYGSNVTRPFLKSWIDGEVVVVCSARLFLTSDSMYCHFFFFTISNWSSKPFLSARHRPHPSWVRSRMQANSLLCCSAWFLFSFLKSSVLVGFFFLHNYTDAEQCSWKHTILQSPFRSDFQIQIIQVWVGPDHFS